MKDCQKKKKIGMGNTNKKEVQKETINKNHREKCQEKIVGILLWEFIHFNLSSTYGRKEQE